MTTRLAGPPYPLSRSKGFRSAFGFSLLEMLTVVAVIGLLAAIAMPLFNEYLIKSNRSAAKAFLMDIVSREEQYAAKNMANRSAATYAVFGQYAPTAVAAAPAATCYGFVAVAAGVNDLNLQVPSELVGRYDFSVVRCNRAVDANVNGTFGDAGDLVIDTSDPPDGINDMPQLIPGFVARAVPVSGSLQENDGELQVNQFGLRLRCMTAGCPSGSSKAKW